MAVVWNQRGRSVTVGGLQTRTARPRGRAVRSFYRTRRTRGRFPSRGPVVASSGRRAAAGLLLLLGGRGFLAGRQAFERRAVGAAGCLIYVVWVRAVGRGFGRAVFVAGGF